MHVLRADECHVSTLHTSVELSTTFETKLFSHNSYWMSKCMRAVASSVQQRWAHPAGARCNNLEHHMLVDIYYMDMYMQKQGQGCPSTVAR